MRRALPAVLLAALVFPGAAFAHASLTSGTPLYGQRLAASPGQVHLRFDQGVKAFPRSIRVLTADGAVVSGPARSGRDSHDIVAALPRLPKGGYTIRWYALSSDGHTVSGVYTFGVRTAAPPVLQAYGSSGPTRTEDVVRWAYFLSLALLIGGMAFRLVVLPRAVPPAAERRSFIVIGIGAVVVLEVGIAAFLLRAEDALQLPFSKLLYGDLSPIVKGTRFGMAFIAMTLGYALVAALVFLAWLTDRIRLLWPALAIGLLFESGSQPLGALGRGRRSLVALGARRLRPPRGGVGLGRRAGDARRRRLAGGEGAAAEAHSCASRGWRPSASPRSSSPGST